MDEMKKMSGECPVCHQMTDDMMMHMKEMADGGDMAHKEGMDKWMMEHKDAM